MVTMTAIWDRTAEVLRGRGSMLAGIAGLLILLPAIVQDAATAYAGRTPGAAPATGLVGLVAALLTVWGTMALVAAASDPATGRDAAIGIGARRLGPAIGVGLLVIVAFGLLLVPAVAMFAAAGVTMTSLAGTAATGAMAGAGTPQIAVSSPGLALAGSAYMLAVFVGAVWLGARLALFWPVLVNERRGIGSIARAFALTRGLTWRIVGVTLLFAILLVVALSAVQLVAAVVARLSLGAEAVATARFVGAAAGALVTAGGTVVSSTFVAQLYRAVTGREAARAFA